MQELYWKQEGKLGVAGKKVVMIARIYRGAFRMRHGEGKMKKRQLPSRGSSLYCRSCADRPAVESAVLGIDSMDDPFPTSGRSNSGREIYIK